MDRHRDRSKGLPMKGIDTHDSQPANQTGKKRTVTLAVASARRSSCDLLTLGTTAGAVGCKKKKKIAPIDWSADL